MQFKIVIELEGIYLQEKSANERSRGVRLPTPRQKIFSLR